MPDHDDCAHPTVQRCEDAYETTWMDKWVCTGCGIDFLPEPAIQTALDTVDAENDRILDMATGVFSAVLWDLHERAFEKHGIPHPTSSPMAEAVCEEKGHDRDADGTCKRCGHNPFLGGK